MVGCDTLGAPGVGTRGWLLAGDIRGIRRLCWGITFIAPRSIDGDFEDVTEAAAEEER